MSESKTDHKLVQATEIDLEETGWVPMEAQGFTELIGPFWTKSDGDQTCIGFIAAETHRDRSGIVHDGMLAFGGRSTRSDYPVGSSLSRRRGVSEFVQAQCHAVRKLRL